MQDRDEHPEPDESGPALSQDGGHGAPASRRTRGTPARPRSPADRPAHPPAAAAHRASPASPLFGLSPPVQAPKPGSASCRSAERTRGRGKCFRGNGPRVGVCKLASVPAGAAAAAGLARRAGVLRRRRTAEETAGGRVWQFQICGAHLELHPENSTGTLKTGRLFFRQ